MSNTSAATGVEQVSNAILGASLSQNAPNPYSGQTAIGFTLPQQVSNDQIVVMICRENN